MCRRQLLAGFLAFLFLPLLAGAGASDDAKQKAQAAAGSWLALADSGRYEESWTAAAAAFQKAVGKEAWKSAIRSAREPLGKVRSRTLKSATYSTSLPGAPDGEYVVLQYDTVFEHKQAAVETITPMREDDGSWKVSGYFVR